MSGFNDVLGGLGSGLAWKAPCAVATTANVLGLRATPIIDGYQTQVGDRVCVWQQSDPTQNGIYDVSLGAWSRSIDFSNSSAVTEGTQVLVNNGTLYTNSIFLLTTSGKITFGTSAIVFQAYVYQPGTGPIKGKIRKITSVTTDLATSADWVIAWNNSAGGAKTQQVPVASALPGQQLIIKDVFGDFATNNNTITPVSGTIDGAATFVMRVNKMALSIISDGGTNWMIAA